LSFAIRIDIALPISLVIRVVRKRSVSSRR
jgi:hypothetical protein